MSISGNTKLIYVIGNPISHSLSPAMHNTALNAQNLDIVYLPLKLTLETLPAFCQNIKNSNILGANVTIPFKEAIIPYLDTLSDEAQVIGAVNTLQVKDDQLIGHNTDAMGFYNHLIDATKFIPSSQTVALLGAGGAAKAIAYILLKKGIQTLHIINRNLNRADTLKKQLSPHLETGQNISVHESGQNTEETVLPTCGLIINTTPLGMTPDCDSTPTQSNAWCHQEQIVYDTIYTPEKTQWLKSCEEKGATICNGLGMLIGQGVLSYNLFTGQEADPKLFKSGIEAVLWKKKI